MTRVDVVVASSAHDVRDARLHRIVAALVRNDLDVEVLAPGDQEHAPNGATYVRAPGKGWGSRFAVNLRVLARRARVLLVLDPDLAITALLWRSMRRGHIVSDVHEDYRAVLHDRAWVGPGRRLVVRALASASARASAAADVTCVADDHVPPRTGRRRLVVRNVPGLDELPEPAEGGARPRAIYVGDLRASRGLFDMVDAIVAVPPWELDLIGPISDADRMAVEARLSASDASQRVRLHGRLTVDEAWRHATGAWIGLAILHDTPAYRRATPSKLYEYLVTGLPVVVSNLPPLCDFVDRTGAGVVADGHADIVARLRDWRDDPAGLRPLRDAALSWRDGLDAESPFSRLADVVSRLVSPQRKASS